MSQDDLLTDAERLMMEEPEDVSSETVKEPVVEEKEAQPEAAGATNEDEPIAEPTPETVVETVVEAANEEPVVPLEPSARYPEVAMTDTVPPELAASIEDLTAKYDASEIDITEFLKQRSLIDRQIVNYQIQEANEHKSYNAWMDAQDNFLNENRHYVDNNIMYGALDTAVRAVQADARSKGMTPSQIMAAADYLVRDSLGLGEKAAPTKPVGEQIKPAVKPSNEIPNIPTLNNIPSSSANDTGTDPFSAIDRLTGDAKEAALLKLSPEQYESYLRA